MKTVKKLRVQSGQYEESCTTIDCNIKTERGLMRRARQLSVAHAVYGDNWAGWIYARVAIADKNDTFGDNQIIGGCWCDPVNGWLDLD